MHLGARNYASTALFAVGVIAEPLATIVPCYESLSNDIISPITVTAQYQPVSTCIPVSVCNYGNCTTSYSYSTYDFVSTVIPCGWDGTSTSTVTVTETGQRIMLGQKTSTLTSFVTVTPPPHVSGWRGRHPHPRVQTLYTTVAKQMYAAYNHMGPLAVPGYEGSGLCQSCNAQDDGSSSQEVDVMECDYDGDDKHCQQYTETWFSQPAPKPTSATSVVCSTSAEVSAAGTYTWAFPRVAPPHTMTAPASTVTVTVTENDHPTNAVHTYGPSVITIAPKPYTVYVTRSCQGPTVFDFTATLTHQFTYTFPYHTQAPATSTDAPVPTDTTGWPWCASASTSASALPIQASTSSIRMTFYSSGGISPILTGTTTASTSTTLTSSATDINSPILTSTSLMSSRTDIMSPIMTSTTSSVASSFTTSSDITTSTSSHTFSTLTTTRTTSSTSSTLSTGTTTTTVDATIPSPACNGIGVTLDPILGICIPLGPTTSAGPSNQDCSLLGLVLDPILRICITPTSTKPNSSGSTSSLPTEQDCTLLGLTLNPILNICITPTSTRPNGSGPTSGVPTEQDCTLLGLSLNPLLNVCVGLTVTTSSTQAPTNGPTTQDCRLLGLKLNPILNLCVEVTNPSTENCLVEGLVFNSLLDICVLPSQNPTSTTTSAGPTTTTSPTSQDCLLLGLQLNPILNICVLPSQNTNPSTTSTSRSTSTPGPTSNDCTLLGLVLNPLLNICVLPSQNTTPTTFATSTTTTSAPQQTSPNEPPTCDVEVQLCSGLNLNDLFQTQSCPVSIPIVGPLVCSVTDIVNSLCVGNNNCQTVGSTSDGTTLVVSALSLAEIQARINSFRTTNNGVCNPERILNLSDIACVDAGSTK